MKGAVNVKYTPENGHGSMERAASPEINPQASGQLIHNKGHKNIQGRRDSLFHQWGREGWTAM